jgi:phage FluMu gp28-like protein
VTEASPQSATPLTRRKTAAGRVLLPWQEAWRRDESPLKIWEKSRRIGATYAEANDAVMSRLAGKRKLDYWFSSADESAAQEFADYCRFWAQKAGAVADQFTERIEDDLTRRAGTAYCVRLANGTKVTAMSSNPRRFRSKGGDVGLDEFAYHDQPKEMFRAAEPSTMWGGRLRILSTHNGENSEFNRLAQMGKRRAAGQGRPGDIPFSLHRTTLPEAVDQGLVERINSTQGTHFGRTEFLAARRASCESQDHWNQEYLAVPSVDSAAWLPYDLIEACQSEACGWDAYGGGLLYVGMDVGEVADPTRIVAVESVGDVLHVRLRMSFLAEPLSVKQGALLELIRHGRVVRACIDATGVGAQIAQEAVRAGKGEAVKFTLAVKDQLASPLRGRFEDRRIRVPDDREFREDLHSVRMVRTAAGAMRFDAERSAAGHGDWFWALALACHAAANVTAGHLWVA